MRQLERALDQAGLRLEHVRLLVCTHAHSDHYGLAAPIIERAGCELWMHPNHAHMTQGGAGPRARLRAPLRGGAPERRAGRAGGRGARGAPRPGLRDRRDRRCRTATSCPAWRWRPTSASGRSTRRPATRPRTWCLHQPERGLLLSGDHLLGRVSLYYDYGYSPDPAGEFLSSLDVVDELDVQLVLAGHGRPVREAHALDRGQPARRPRAGRARARARSADGPRDALRRRAGDARLGDAERA